MWSMGGGCGGCAWVMVVVDGARKLIVWRLWLWEMVVAVVGKWSSAGSWAVAVF